MEGKRKIHPAAIIDPRAEIHEGAEIGPWCNIGPYAKIGPGTRLLSHVVVDGHTTIGENNTVYPFAVLGAAPQDLKYRGESTRLEIGNNNTIRESVTINLGTVQGGGLTQVGNNNLMMAYTHFGHDCIIGSHCIFANYSGLAGHVIVDDFANIAGMVGVSQFVRVGSYAYIAGQSGLEKSVPPYTIAIGSRPTILRGANIVGLRRRGFSAETITKINESIKLWIRPDAPKEQCLLEIESQYGDAPEIQSFVSFIRNASGVVK